MHKSVEQENQLKLAIRDIVARNPLISVHQLRRDLADKGFKTTNGTPLDWYYVAKVVRKLNREKALAVDLQKVNERIAETKERYRVMVEMLWRILDYKMEYVELYNLWPPKNDERIKAANTLRSVSSWVSALNSLLRNPAGRAPFTKNLRLNSIA